MVQAHDGMSGELVKAGAQAGLGLASKKRSALHLAHLSQLISRCVNATSSANSVCTMEY